ncbi:L-fucose mutarotase, type 2 [Sphingobium indicum BiD32]|uniref:L-fucose mutarotase, type 2 n=1 Tax=Sphingobium indicum BiD32 TaxID=1301087 RepID=N1MR96_9SPHN|nr:L-rhamnose mutarotase [Sphingobium indicum]CCW19244.1 L-fucose mutarotase, type 2 [Sphingobium indicum BiD32]
MQKHVLILDLVDDAELIARYEAFHAPGAVWAEIIDSIRAAGILAMDIYRHGSRLVMTMETVDEFSFAAKARADADNPAVQRWEALMAQFQRPVPGTPVGEKWQRAERIFDLALQDVNGQHHDSETE